MKAPSNKIIAELKLKYGLSSKTMIADLPDIMSKEDWQIFACFLKYPRGIKKEGNNEQS